MQLKVQLFYSRGTTASHRIKDPSIVRVGRPVELYCLSCWLSSVNLTLFGSNFVTKIILEVRNGCLSILLVDILKQIYSKYDMGKEYYINLCLLEIQNLWNLLSTHWSITSLIHEILCDQSINVQSLYESDIDLIVQKACWMNNECMLIEQNCPPNLMSKLLSTHQEDNINDHLHMLLFKIHVHIEENFVKIDFKYKHFKPK